MNRFVFTRSDLLLVINSPVCDNNRHNVCKKSAETHQLIFFFFFFFTGTVPSAPEEGQRAPSRLVTPVPANRRAAPLHGAGQWLRAVGVSVGCEVRFVEFAK